MIRSLKILCVLSVLLLTLKEAMDLHCKLSCEEDGEISGKWNEKEQGCECGYIRIHGIPVSGKIVTPKEEKEEYRPYR